MRAEPFNHLLRVLGEVVVAIPAAGGAFDPEQLSLSYTAQPHTNQPIVRQQHNAPKQTVYPGEIRTSVVWQMPPRDFEQCFMILIKLKQRMFAMDTTQNSDSSFPYVLVCSTVGTIVSPASVWLATALSFAPVVGA